jgi:hypothetical protein
MSAKTAYFQLVETEIFAIFRQKILNKLLTF